MKETALYMRIGALETINEQLRYMNDQLRYENAKLQGAAERDADALESLNLSLEEARGENAKLRNLVEGLLQCCGEIRRDRGCDACPLNDLGHAVWCTLRPTLRELGFEVRDANR